MLGAWVRVDSELQGFQEKHWVNEMPDLEACSLLFFFGPRLCTVCQWWMDDFGLEMIDQHRPAISSLHLRSFLHVALWLRCRHLAKSIDTMHTTSISFCRRRALLGKGRVLRHVAPRDTEAEIARSVEIRGCPGRGLSIRFTGNHRFFFGGDILVRHLPSLGVQ
jgi:hypothetical protein